MINLYSYCSFIETSPRPVDEEEGEEFLFDNSGEEVWALVHTLLNTLASAIGVV